MQPLCIAVPATIRLFISQLGVRHADCAPRAGLAMLCRWGLELLTEAGGMSIFSRGYRIVKHSFDVTNPGDGLYCSEFVEIT